MTNPIQPSLFAGPGSQSSIVASFTVPGEPASKARPRFDHRGSKSHVYTPAKTKAAEEKVAAFYLAAAHKRGTDPNVTYGVLAHFYNGTHQRRDVDNMIKLVLDGLNKVAFPDDVQVVEIVGRKSFVAKKDARTEIILYRVGLVEHLTKACEQCGKDFITWPSLVDAVRFCSHKCGNAWREEQKKAECLNCGKIFLAHGKTDASTRKFCSRECRAEYGSVEIKCDWCGTLFSRYRSWVRAMNYCSSECSQKAMIERRRNAKCRPGKCRVCGAGTSRKEYTRCNDCRLSGLEK